MAINAIQIQGVVKEMRKQDIISEYNVQNLVFTLETASGEIFDCHWERSLPVKKHVEVKKGSNLFVSGELKQETVTKDGVDYPHAYIKVSKAIDAKDIA